MSAKTPAMSAKTLMSPKAPTRLLTFLLTSLYLVCVLPAGAFAQDDGTMSFGVDEVEEGDGDQQQDDSSGEDDGTMSFGAQEVQDQDNQADTAPGTYTVAVVVIPSDALSRDERIELQDEMREKVSLDPNYQAKDGAPVLNGLQEAGLASCITEPLCLSGIGQNAGVDRILMGRVEQGRGLNLNIDLFDVNDKLFVKYTSAKRLANFGAVKDAVEPAMKDIFDIRVARKGPNYGEEASSGTVQTVLAYTAAGLSVAALAGGIYFGTQASSGEDDILGKKNDSGQYTISQVEAERMARDAKDDALTANVMYGASAGLAVISGILFYVKSGSDVAGPEGQRRASILDDIDITPTFGTDNVGLGATFSF